MRHTVYTDSDTYPVALLIKATAYNLAELETAVIKPLKTRGINRNDTISLALEYGPNGKASATFIKTQMDIILPALASIGTQFLYCADAHYFKWLTKVAKAEPNLGYRLPCKIKGYEHLEVILGVNHRSLFYNPANEAKLTMSLDTLAAVVNGTYQGIGTGIIKAAYYPTALADIKNALDALHQYPELACDLETFSLDFDKAGIGTVTFCWSQHEGIAFACDYKPHAGGGLIADKQGNYGSRQANFEVRAELKKFFTEYQGTIKWHNAPYDLSITIYELWMSDLLDTNGLLTGLEVLTERWHDTKIIAYLATNSAAGNHLSLKELAHPFAGNWANSEIKDIRKIPLPVLLEYNLLDGLSTNYVFDTFYPQMIADQQLTLYNEQMMPSQKTIIQVEMTGMPLNPVSVQNAKLELQAIVEKHNNVLQSIPLIAKFNLRIRTEAMNKANAELKTKQHPISYFADPTTKHYKAFNPASSIQLKKLLYEEMGLPILKYTKTKQPSTGGKTLAKVVNHTTDPEYIAILNSLIAMATARKILEAFIPAFEKALDKGDGVVWLHGSFNMGGTKSGRLSSSGPNLQNIPATSVYGKLIKGCFEAPKGWIFCGADFNSLEDYISALTTRDPNKLKVYLDGYDGHCLRAFNYFPDELPGIVDTVASINSIEKLFPEIRQKSKGPTFALTYQGTWRTLMTNLGLSEDQARQIEANYHELYKVSDAWVQDKLDEAAVKGYVTLAFGLRLRTPLLAQTMRGRSSTPYEAEAEGRTAGNALGQSYGLLNNRAMNAFMARVWASPYRLDIKPSAPIHDAIYLVIKDDVAVVEWVNNELIKAMQWQDLPELKHNQVKLGAALDIFWPAWDNKIGLPNAAGQKEIRAICKAGQQKYAAAKAA